ncbi:unnamed protein product, partial [Rotaria sp. Silwood1]
IHLISIDVIRVITIDPIRFMSIDWRVGKIL